MHDETTITMDALDAALARGELVFHYQPRVSMLLGAIVGAEALIRWVRPDGTIIPPGAFIPAAEACGHITAITAELFPRLLGDLAILHDLDVGVRVSFNVAAPDFSTEGVARQICDAVQCGLLDPERFEIELTESAALSVHDDAIERLHRLRDLGIPIAMDDFGTGYSGLDTLGRLPFKTVKIDQAIVRRMRRSPKDAAIVEASLRMIHEAELESVAEGIEDEETYLQLQSWGCAQGQGFWISRPIPIEAFVDLCRSDQRWPAHSVGMLHIAMLDHLAWRKSVMDLLFYGTRSAEAQRQLLESIPCDPRRCRLGQWHAGVGRVFAGVASYAAVEAEHNAVHEFGVSLLRAASEGRSRAELVPLFRRLSQQSMRLIEVLQELEQEALTRHTRPLPLEAARIAARTLSH